MRYLFPGITLLIVLLSGVSCNRTYDPIEPHTAFIYPMDEGKYRIYQVIDTIFATANPNPIWGGEVLTSLKKEVANGTETDLMGRELSKLYIYASTDTTDSTGSLVYNFNYSELWTQYKGETFGERIEGNTRYQVLRFPVYKGLSWDGNLYNADEPQTYRYLSTDTSVTILGQTYENCVVVLQTPFRRSGSQSGSIYIEEYAYEVYAPYIGKIKKYSKNYEEQSGTPVQESRIYQEILIEHN
ncbi:MAG: hypothetical protein H6581_08215 [Bacteroidia bacterium]|nr:hypothetical protein [Bacteroidia bacterium]